MELSEVDLSVYTVDFATIRLDEHYRTCLWCAKHPDEKCQRAKLLIYANNKQAKA